MVRRPLLSTRREARTATPPPIAPADESVTVVLITSMEADGDLRMVGEKKLPPPKKKQLQQVNHRVSPANTEQTGGGSGAAAYPASMKMPPPLTVAVQLRTTRPSVAKELPSVSTYTPPEQGNGWEKQSEARVDGSGSAGITYWANPI